MSDPNAVIDPVAAADGEGTPTPPAPPPVAPPAPPAPAPTVDLNGETLKVLNEIKDSLKPAGAPALSREEFREALKEKTGFNDAQLDMFEKMQAAAVQSSSKQVAELNAKLSWTEFKAEAKLDTALEKIMDEELKQYPVEMRGDKVLLKKVHYMALGIQAEQKSKAAPPPPPPAPVDGDEVLRRTIVSNNQGSSQGLANGGQPPKSAAAKLTDDEKQFARKMRMSEEDYAAYKTSAVVEDYKKK